MKKSLKGISLLFILLILVIIGCTYLIKKTKENNYLIKKTKENNEAIEQQETIFQCTSNIMNNTDLGNYYIAIVQEYLDLYYQSVGTCEYQECDALFCSNFYAKLNEYSTMLQIETRKAYDFDFTMSDVSYCLTIEEYQEYEDKVYIKAIEDDVFQFAFLDIPSYLYGIELEVELTKVDGSYTISYLNKEIDYFNLFTSHDLNNVSDIEYYYELYKNELIERIEEENLLKSEAQENELESNLKVKKKYDRDAAKEYIDSYCHDRNDEYYDFSDEGGNCQNYVSQCIHESGLKMDLIDEIWKYYSPSSDSSEEEFGRSPSWAGVSYFYNYIIHNEKGLVGIANINRYYGEVGDVIQVGYDEKFVHSTIISKVIDDHILINSNSNDCKDYPLEAYVYPDIRCIKILGTN